MSLSQGELLDNGLHQLLTTVLADLKVRAQLDMLGLLRCSSVDSLRHAERGQHRGTR